MAVSPGQKSSSQTPTLQKTILFVGRPTPLFKTRLWILQRAGYSVITCATESQAVRQLKTQSFDLLVLGSSNNSRQVASIARTAKTLAKPIPVLSFAAAQSTDIDVRLGSLEKPNLLLKSAGELIMRDHDHPELHSDLVVFADAERHLIHVSDNVCRLLDYAREELIGMRIEEISEAPTEEVAAMFREYIREGGQSGLYVLKTRKGEKIPISYKARILQDGCMVAEWKVLKAS